jgi:fatty acid desaturase
MCGACAQMFVVGHDCGHRSFSKNRLLEDIVGTLMFMPLIYPFEPWRIKHNHHHAHTNKCPPAVPCCASLAAPSVPGVLLQDAWFIQ